MTDDFYTAIRALNVLLVCVISIRMMMKYTLWRRQNDEIKLYGLMLAGLMLSAVYGTIEQLVLGIPGGPRVFVLTAPLLWGLVASFWNQVRWLINKLSTTIRREEV